MYTDLSLPFLPFVLLVLEFPLLRANPRQAGRHVDVTLRGQVTAVQTQSGRPVLQLLVLGEAPRVVNVVVVHARNHHHVPRVRLIVLHGGAASFRPQHAPLR